MGCTQWGDSLPLKGSSHSGVTAFGTVDFLTPELSWWLSSSRSYIELHR